MNHFARNQLVCQQLRTDGVSVRPCRGTTRAILTAAAFLLAGGNLLGCAGNTHVLSSQLESLKHDVAKLRSANSLLQDRVDGLEATSERKMEADESAAAKKTSDRPKLEVVRLGPAAEPGEVSVADATIPLDDGPRPAIVGDGTDVKKMSSDEAEKRASARPSPRPTGQRKGGYR